jgi:HK97 family phage major capsid protein
MRVTDQVMTRLAAEIEQQQTFQDKLLETAEKESRDLTENEMELFTRSRDRMGELNTQLGPVKESRRISNDSQTMLAELHKFYEEPAKKQQEVEYRSAGQYVNDVWQAKLGIESARERLDLYQRAAAHQTTADNPGLLPTPVVAPVLNFIDSNRPMVNFLGPRQIPSNSWTRPKVTQHATVALQPVGEKNELVSQKLTITKNTVTAATYGGYVNVSRQDIDWAVPGIMDIVINDLAAVYAKNTEAAFGTALVAGATAGSTIPTGAPTSTALNSALWAAASACYTATGGQGNLVMFVAPDMLATWGALLLPVNPQTAISPGFEAGNFNSGLMGQISGIPVYMTNGLTAGSSVLVSSAAVEVYEDRIGSLQVVEPSVLGVQVAYAGYFAPLVVGETGSIVKIAKTP